jgi:putative PIN family toxin of toxin-antitoxin system
MRVVLDTNILVSALWKPGGLEAQVIALAREGKIVACVSEALWAEYLDVLSRRKFSKFAQAATDLITVLDSCARRIETAAKVAWSTDEDDNRVLECLQDGGAEYLITGNLRHFPSEWAGAKIVNARMFLNFYATGFVSNPDRRK